MESAGNIEKSDFHLLKMLGLLPSMQALQKWRKKLFFVFKKSNSSS